MRISRPSSKEPPYNFYEMELIGDHHFTVAVPIDAKNDLKRKVVGVLKTHLLGQKSVDYVLKKFGSHWIFPPPEEDRVFFLNTLRAVDNTISVIIEKLSSGEKKRPDHVGLFAAEMALIRLKPTFLATIFLIMQGYAFETAALCRLILEQYGFAYTVFTINDTEKILQTKVTKTISNLKKLLPYSGKLYGELSSQSHLDPKDTRHYIGIKNGIPIVRYVMPESTKGMLYYFLKLVVDFSKVVQKVSGEYIQFSIENETSINFKKNYESINSAIRTLEEELFKNKAS